MVTVVLGGIEEVIQTFPPMMAPFPMTVLVPKMVAPEYMMTSSSMVGWRFLPLSFETSPRAARLAVPKMVKNGFYSPLTSCWSVWASHLFLISLQEQVFLNMCKCAKMN